MNFCPHCGAKVHLRIPPGDILPRHVCDQCDSVHYSNPKLVVGAIVDWQERILLCRRAIEPRRGLWTLPSGFMENSESTITAAVRETREEACARIETIDLFALINLPRISQVHLMYRARLLDKDIAPGQESLEVGLFREQDIPWEKLAFRTNRLSLQLYFADRSNQSFFFHTCDLD